WILDCPPPSNIARLHCRRTGNHFVYQGSEGNTNNFPPIAALCSSRVLSRLAGLPNHLHERVAAGRPAVACNRPMPAETKAMRIPGSPRDMNFRSDPAAIQ